MSTPGREIVKAEPATTYRQMLRLEGYDSFVSPQMLVIVVSAHARRLGYGAVVMSMQESAERLRELNTARLDDWMVIEKATSLPAKGRVQEPFLSMGHLEWENVSHDLSLSLGDTELQAVQGAVINYFDPSYLSEIAEQRLLAAIEAEPLNPPPFYF